MTFLFFTSLYCKKYPSHYKISAFEAWCMVSVYYIFFQYVNVKQSSAKKKKKRNIIYDDRLLYKSQLMNHTLASKTIWTLKPHLYKIHCKKQSKNKVSAADTLDLFMELIFGNQLVC